MNRKVLFRTLATVLVLGVLAAGCEQTTWSTPSIPDISLAPQADQDTAKTAIDLLFLVSAVVGGLAPPPGVAVDVASNEDGVTEMTMAFEGLVVGADVFLDGEISTAVSSLETGKLLTNYGRLTLTRVGRVDRVDFELRVVINTVTMTSVTSGLVIINNAKYQYSKTETGPV